MTINGPAIVLLCFYIALADKRGTRRKAIGGTVQNDCLKEFIAQHAWLVPPRPAMRIVTDMIEFASREVPRWNPVSISGYHIREAGATAAQELAFTLADGLAYVESCLARGLDVDDFAPRLSFFFDVHNDFFEEIAKFRAARRAWARFMKERYGAKKADSMKLRTHAQTAGVSLTAQQPYNNVVRVALQAMAAVLGGTQSLHTNSLDETYALPTEEAVTIALRTQQIILAESGVANTIDPLGGSYFVEWLTDKLEREALEYIDRIDEMGGMVAAIEKGYPQREIAASSYRFQRELENATSASWSASTNTSRQDVDQRPHAAHRRGGAAHPVPEPRPGQSVARRRTSCTPRSRRCARRRAGARTSCLRSSKRQGLRHRAGDLRRPTRGARDLHRSGRVLSATRGC